MRLARFISARLVLAVPQVVGITLITFFMIRLLPGNPAYGLAGAFATKATILDIQRSLGLNKPAPLQFVIYVQGLLHGDLGPSWFTGHPVAEEISRRLPATVELISIATAIIVLGGLTLGVVGSLPRGQVVDTAFRVYGLLAGAFPDFWLGLVLIFILYFHFGVFPAPLGRIDLSVTPPRTITGMYTVDSLLSGNWEAFQSALAHLILPVATLVIVYTAPIARLTRATMQEMSRSEFCTYARACGLPNATIVRYALRNSLPSVVTLVGLTYGYLLGGAVLVENVFAWGGLGSYVVDSVNRSDYFAVQGFVLLAALFNLFIYLVVDLLYLWIDPRIEV